ncbi:MAG: glycosyl hydrolase 53 family protein [Thermoflexaceae bacterium]|nr:glycosyl hydrolase 53 family protein [Thermoflexaceae bacterium]
MVDFREEFVKGVDVSSLREVEACGGKFFDEGKQGDLFDILKRYGINYVRLKLWNDPFETVVDEATGNVEKRAYGAGTNDLETTILLAKRATSCGMGFLLNFHYSDFWADPGKQTVPKAWMGFSVTELETAVYEFTRNSVLRLIEEGAKPSMVQIGNEITNGLLWPLGKKPDLPEDISVKRSETEEMQYQNIARFISAGIRAVREIDASIPIMIHLDNGGKNAMYRDWFDHFIKYATEDFDIIGFSYYPFWHGPMKDLEFNLKDMAARYGKYVIVDEVSMGYTMEDYAKYEKLPADKRKGMATKPALVEKIEHPMTKEGQCRFMQDILQIIKGVPENMGRGFFYWEPAWIPVPGSEWANEAALSYTGEKGPGGNEWANQALFDYDGNALPALSVIRDF